MAQLVGRLVLLGKRRDRELDAAEDGGEQVVEVVRDAGGEAADRLDLLHLPELRLRRRERGFGAMAFRDVVDHDEVRLAASPDDRRGVNLGLERFAGFHAVGQDPGVALPRNGPAHEFLEVRHLGRRAHVAGRHRQELVERVSEPLDRRVVRGEEPAAGDFPYPHGERIPLEHEAVAPLVFRERLRLGLDGLRHLVERGGERAEFARARHRPPPREVAPGDRLRIRGERDDRPADAAGHERDDEEGERDRQEDHEQFAARPRRLLQHCLGGPDADDDDPRCAADALPGPDPFHAVEFADVRPRAARRRLHLEEAGKQVFVLADKFLRLDGAKYDPAAQVEHGDDGARRERARVGDVAQRVEPVRLVRDRHELSGPPANRQAVADHPSRRVGPGANGLADRKCPGPQRLRVIAAIRERKGAIRTGGCV